MKITKDGTDYEVRLEDDGTLDTVVSVNGEWIRFNSEDVRDVPYDDVFTVGLTYGTIESLFDNAIDAYEDNKL